MSAAPPPPPPQLTYKGLEEEGAVCVMLMCVRILHHEFMHDTLTYRRVKYI